MNSRCGRPVDHTKEVALLDAAQELLFTQGPSKLSMEAVARKAGVSKVTLYSRFADKRMLVEATIRRQSTELVKQLAITPDSEQEPAEALYDFGLRLLQFILCQNHLNFLRMLGSIREVDHELLHRIYENGAQASHSALSQWFSTQHQAGRLNCPEPEFAAEMFLCMLAGLDIVRSLHHLPPRQPGDEIAQHVSRVVATCLRAWQAEK